MHYVCACILFHQWTVCAVEFLLHYILVTQSVNYTCANINYLAWFIKNIYFLSFVFYQTCFRAFENMHNLYLSWFLIQNYYYFFLIVWRAKFLNLTFKCGVPLISWETFLQWKASRQLTIKLMSSIVVMSRPSGLRVWEQ